MASVALAFGSFGDIVTLIQILVDLAGTLRDGRASAEYRELIAEFSSLQSVLENIKAEILTPGLGAPIFDQSSLNAIGLAVQRCHTLVKDFSDSTYGYGRSLMVGEPGNNLWDFWWNVNWRILKKGAIADLREQLTQQKTAMILILTLSSSASLHRMEQQLKQVAAGKSTQEHRRDSSHGVPPPYLSTDPVPPFNGLSPSSEPSSLGGPSNDHFEGSAFTFPPDETLPQDPPAQDNRKYQLPLPPLDSVLLSPPPPPPPKLVKPGWRKVPRARPRINTNTSTNTNTTGSSLLDPPLTPRTPSPGLFGPSSPDSAVSNVGRPGGYGRIPPPPTSPDSLLGPSMNGPNVDGAYVHRSGPPYVDTTYKQDGWGFPLLAAPASGFTGAPPSAAGKPALSASWAGWYPSPELAPSPVSPMLDSRVRAPPVPPRGLFGPRTPDDSPLL